MHTMTQSLTVSALALLAFSLPAAAQDYKVTGQFGWFGVGKAVELEKDHVIWVGEFSGTFFNDKGANSLFDRSGVRCPATYDLNFGKKQGHANGYCVIMGEGSPSDQAFLKWSCDGDTVNCSGTFEYTGGTGKYQSASGSNTFRASGQLERRQRLRFLHLEPIRGKGARPRGWDRAWRNQSIATALGHTFPLSCSVAPTR